MVELISCCFLLFQKAAFLKIKSDQDRGKANMAQTVLQRKLEPERHGLQDDSPVTYEQFQTCKDHLAAIQKDYERVIATVEDQTLRLNVMAIESEMQPEYFSKLVRAVYKFFDASDEPAFTFRKQSERKPRFNQERSKSPNNFRRSKSKKKPKTLIDDPYNEAIEHNQKL